MKTKEIACPKADKNFTAHSTYTLSDFKYVAPIIDADARQLARYNRGRPSVFSEVIVA